MTRLTAALDTVWQRKWWIVAPTVITALVTGAAASYLLPARYRSEAIIHITPQRVPEDIASFVIADRPRDERFHDVALQVLSRTRLERIIADFKLYDANQGVAPEADLVTQMRRDVAVSPVPADHDTDAGARGFRVSFVAADPNTAMRVTERIASLFIEENLRDQKVMTEGVGQFLESQIYDARARIIEYEKRLETLRAQQGHRPLSRADLLPYEVLQESYKALLVRAEGNRVSQGIERRQIGEQFRILDPPSLPEQPVGPSRLEASGAGAFLGLAVGLLLVGVRSGNRVAGGAPSASHQTE